MKPAIFYCMCPSITVKLDGCIWLFFIHLKHMNQSKTEKRCIPWFNCNPFWSKVDLRLLKQHTLAGKMEFELRNGQATQLRFCRNQIISIKQLGWFTEYWPPSQFWYINLKINLVRKMNEHRMQFYLNVRNYKRLNSYSSIFSGIGFPSFACSENGTP